MKLRLLTSALALAGLATPALAQSADPAVEAAREEMVIIEPAILDQAITLNVVDEEEELKREILREVDRRIAKQLDALRRDIRKMLAGHGQEQRNFSAPRPPQAPHARRAPRAPQPPQGPRVFVRKEMDERRAKAEQARKQALLKRAEAMKKHAYQQRQGAPQRMRLESRSGTKDGHARIRIEVNGKVIEKVIPLGEDFAMELPGGKVWVKTDGHARSSKAKKHHAQAKKFAHKNLKKHDSKRSFDFDFEHKGDREEFRRKMERFGRDMERRGEEFGRRMEEWGKKMEREMPERMRRAHREGRVLELELEDLQKHLPDLHRQLEKLMDEMEPGEREELRRAMQELHGVFREMEGPRGERRAPSRKQFENYKKQYEKAAKKARKPAQKKQKKSKRQLEEESF